jgi:hypothetical protein
MIRALSAIVITFGFVLSLKAQDLVHDTAFSRPDFAKVGGLVSYFFWEEDSSHVIKRKGITKPFLQNYIIQFNDTNQLTGSLSLTNLKKSIVSVAHELPISKHTFSISIHDSSSSKHIRFRLKRTLADVVSVICYRKYAGVWRSESLKKVLYFNIYKNGSSVFSHSSDSVYLNILDNGFSVRNVHHVFSYLNDSNNVIDQRVFSYTGEDLTMQFGSHIKPSPKRIMLFVNGYRGIKAERDETDHLITLKDRYNYWYKIDNKFITILKPNSYFYIDASMSLNTTTHRSSFNIAKSFLRSRFILNKKKARDRFKSLNTESNASGFAYRKKQGTIGSQVLLATLCNMALCEGVMDTIDFASHSMGYAYSLGMIEALKGKVVFGKMYILAPENACSDGFDWSLFEEVWQYGSNLDQAKPDALWEQDGIAPQCQVKGLENELLKHRGRAFIPADWKKKNFIDSHMLYNFDWIFQCIKKGESGYIGR